MPKVSIIMPNKNNAKWLPKSIGSVINQTYKNWELVIVDDHSTDNSLEIIKEFMDRDSRIDCICNPDVTYPLTKNIGLESSSGKYVVFLDSDDWLSSNFLERGVEHFKGVESYVSSFRVIRPNGSSVDIVFKRGVYDSVYGIKRYFWLENGNSILKRKIIVDWGLEFPKYKYNEDVYFYVLYLSISRNVYVDDYIGLNINRIGSTLVNSKNEIGIIESIKVFNEIIQQLEKIGKSDLIPIVKKYTFPPSLLTYLDGLNYKKRLIYGVRFLPLLLRFDWRNYYAKNWYIGSFINLFIPVKWLLRRLIR